MRRQGMTVKLARDSFPGPLCEPKLRRRLAKRQLSLTLQPQPAAYLAASANRPNPVTRVQTAALAANAFIYVLEGSIVMQVREGCSIWRNAGSRESRPCTTKYRKTPL